MGYTFSAMIVRGSARAVRDGLKAYYKARGYARAAAGEEADCALRLYAPAGGDWVIVAGSAPELGSADGVRRVARALNCPVVAAENFDSDVLSLTLTDGAQKETLQYGSLSDDPAPALPEETPLWDAVLGGRAEQLKRLFRRKHDFSETILRDAAPLTCWPEDILSLPLDEEGEDGPKPFCTLRLRAKDGRSAFLTDRDAPPAFSISVTAAYGNPCGCMVEPAGGEGCGVRVELRAVGYDPAQYTLSRCCLSVMQGREDAPLTFFAEAERCAFSDGKRGWTALFPDAPIDRGVNPGSPAAQSLRAAKYRIWHGVAFDAALLGRQFDAPSGGMDLTDAEAAQRDASLIKTRCTEVRVVPLQNPQGANDPPFRFPLFPPNMEDARRMGLIGAESTPIDDRLEKGGNLMAMKLASARQALATIVIPADATEQEKYASQELRNYLDLMTSAVFEIAAAPFTGPQIALGRAAHAFLPPDDGLGEDGFAIRALPGAIAIAGGKRGVIYGVYELLERLGCRFFTPECEQVPCRVELDAPLIDTRQVPRLEHRDHNYFFYHTCPRFAVKSRINGHSAAIPEKFGGHQSYTWFVHTFEQLVPTDVYGESHPEYFALYDGARCTLKHRTQLCLSNPEVLRIATESARAALRAHPETRIISISQNDINHGCECDACRAIDREEGSPSGTLLRFVNAIAEALEPEFPQVVFDTLAYNYTRPVPKITHPRHNVCVRLCSIECCFSHPFETCDDDRGVTLPDGTRSSFIRDLRQWGAFHDRLYIWDYTTCFAHYAAPFPNWRTLQPNMQAFVKNNVKGVFEQANSGSRGGVDLNELRAYVISKLLWDADCDVKKHIEEFTDYYYGAAAPFIRAYIDALCDKAEQDDIHVGFNDQTDTPLYADEMLDKLNAILDQAEEAVRGDALRLWRVGKARLGVRWVRLKNDAMLKNELDPETVNRFFADWCAYGMGRLDEWVSQETTHRALLKNVWRGVQFYEHWLEEGREEIY